MMYNLLEQPWLSVIYNNGVAARISLIEALSKAHQLQIAYPNPMDRIAVFRFFLALSYWCHANTQQDPKPNESLPSEWISWISQNQEYFDLLGDTAGFMQVKGLNRIRPIADLIHEIPSSTNHWHFRHVTDYIDGLCPACCTMGILRLPVFTTIGGRGFGNGVNGCPPIYSVWWKASLIETILSNWHPVEKLGTPAWLMQISPEKNEEIMLLTGLTLSPRKVFLARPSTEKKRCSCCGSLEPLVYYCYLEDNKIPGEIVWDDPHVLKDCKGNNIKAHTEPLASNSKAFLDRDWYKHVAALLRSENSLEKGRRLIVGFTSDQNNYIDTWELSVDIGAEDLEEEAIYKTEHWQESVNETFKGKHKDRRYKYYAYPCINDVITRVEDNKSQIDLLLRNSQDNRAELNSSYGSHLRTLSFSIAPGHSVAKIEGRNKLRSFVPIPKKHRKKNVVQEGS